MQSSIATGTCDSERGENRDRKDICQLDMNCGPVSPVANSVVVALLYMMNGLIIADLLRHGTMDIVVNEKTSSKMFCLAKDDRDHFSISMISEQQQVADQEKEVGRNEVSKGVPTTDTSTVLMKCHDVTSPANQHSQLDDHYITNCIRDEVDRNSDNEVNNYDNSHLNLNSRTDHCNNSVVVAVNLKEHCQYEPSRSNSKWNSRSHGKLQQRSTSTWNQVSRRKVTPIPLLTATEAGDLKNSHHTDHFSAHFMATQKHAVVFLHRENNMKSDLTVHVTGPVELPYRQHQPEQDGIVMRRHHWKGEDYNSRHSGYERSSDDDSISGSFVEPIYQCKNSAAVELKNLNLDLQPELLLVEIPTQNVRNDSCKDIGNPNFQQICLMSSQTYGRRGSGRGSQRRCYSKHEHRRGSGDIQHPSYTTHTESDDESSPSPTSYRSTLRNRYKIPKLSREGESIDPSCMPSIVAAIDSGRESEIIRNNSPRRTSSRDKKMRNKGLDAIIRAQSDDERFGSRQRTPHDKPFDAYLVTEF
uniref:Uncharacterized protein n=1 Tax=Setaria digitata TaxID=48799 RepID=A0A915PRM4_9BILA